MKRNTETYKNIQRKTLLVTRTTIAIGNNNNNNVKSLLRNNTIYKAEHWTLGRNRNGNRETKRHWQTLHY